ncbi:hypothetical protein AAHA92_14231 [Salvia divinorum]|uniref:Retrotransposon gag domain-containing protein n=1 Tax=Salvia divinorum TaxID=28513 RepID=A0ABD1HAW7_SALDI
MADRDDDPEIGALNAHLSGEPAQGIVVSGGQAAIEVKNNVLAVMPHFYGRKVDNPYVFLHEFCKLCGIQKRPAGSTEEEYILRALPFALKARQTRATRTNALKKEIQGATQEGDETLSMYWSRFKGMLDACPNNRMTEAEIFNNFYEGMTSESKDLVNSSSGGDFSRLRAYDNPRAQAIRRTPVHAAADQADDKMEARMNRLEKTVLNALEKNKQPAPAEKCQAPLGQEEAFTNYGPPMEMDYQQANAMGNWNPGGYWNQSGGWVPKQRDAPWREHPNFRRTEPNSNPHPQSSNAQPQEERPHWPSKNNEGQNNWNRGQVSQPNWSSRNQQNQYVPPHQRGQQGGQGQGQGPSGHYNHGPRGNFHHPQGG